MKKIFTLLLLATLISVFSGCVYVNTDVKYHHRNTLYVYNDSRYTIRDWYVEAEDGVIYNPTRENTVIERNSRGKINDLPNDYYRVWIRLDEFEWDSTNFTHIYCDTNYYVCNYRKDDYFQNRAAITNNNEESDTLFLMDDQGNIIELEKVNK